MAGVRFDRCPICWLADQPETLTLIDDYLRAKQGHLPRKDGVEDQSVKFVEAWGVLDGAFAELAERDAKEAEEKRKRKGEQTKPWRRPAAS